MTTVALLLCLAMSGFARDRRTQNPFTPDHEFRLGVGAYPLIYDISESKYPTYGFQSNDLSHTYDRNLIYAGPEYVTGSLSLGYVYNIKRWLSAGATVSYYGRYRTYYDRITDARLGSHNMHNISITPTVRFTYLNRKYVSLYSSVGLGLGVCTVSGNVEGVGREATELFFTGHITPFGVSAGNKVFGFAEVLGLGNQGAFVIGVGYKFK